MCNDYNSFPLMAHSFSEILHHNERVLLIQGACRFVSQYDLLVANQATDNGDTLPLSSGKVFNCSFQFVSYLSFSAKLRIFFCILHCFCVACCIKWAQDYLRSGIFFY